MRWHVSIAGLDERGSTAHGRQDSAAEAGSRPAAEAAWRGANEPEPAPDAWRRAGTQRAHALANPLPGKASTVHVPRMSLHFFAALTLPAPMCHESPPDILCWAEEACDLMQEQQRHRAIMYKVYSRRAVALQRAALDAWCAATAAAQDKAAALRALMLRSKQRRLQGVIDKSAPWTCHVFFCLSETPHLTAIQRHQEPVHSLSLLAFGDLMATAEN